MGRLVRVGFVVTAVVTGALAVVPGTGDAIALGDVVDLGHGATAAQIALTIAGSGVSVSNVTFAGTENARVFSPTGRRRRIRQWRRHGHWKRPK